MVVVLLEVGLLVDLGQCDLTLRNTGPIARDDTPSISLILRIHVLLELGVGVDLLVVDDARNNPFGLGAEDVGILWTEHH